METNLLHFLPSKSPSSPISVHTYTSTITKRLLQTQPFFPRIGGQSFRVSCATNSPSNDDTPQPVPPSITPPDTVEIRFKRRSRRRSRQRGEEDATTRQPLKAQASDPPKKWEDMSVAEKAIELYMGEKGVLFWLNKFAYASIFIVIGGWIAFRFAGPALNLYQLDAPPLSPSSIFKGQ